MLQTLLLTAMSVAREREQGTFDQLLVTPFRPAEIMAGKALAVACSSARCRQRTSCWWRSSGSAFPSPDRYVTLYAGLCLFLLAAVGIGLLVSSVVATMQQAMLFSFVVMMPFTLLSGLTTPLSSMPQVLQFFTLINPLRYAIDIAQRVYLEGAGLETLAARPMAAGGDGRGDAGGGVLDVPPSAHVRCAG